jgi:hypothetical protein
VKGDFHMTPARYFQLSVAAILTFSSLGEARTVLAPEGAPAPDNAAVGWIDLADSTAIAGWAMDPDNKNPIAVHIYVDGKFATAVVAKEFRADVGDHAFHWVHPGFGPGKHSVAAYAIGITRENTLSGTNPPLFPGKPIEFYEKETEVAAEMPAIEVPPTISFGPTSEPGADAPPAAAPAPASAEPLLTLRWR